MPHNENIITERCAHIVTHESAELISDYFKQHPHVPVTVSESNRIKHLVTKSLYVRPIAISQLINEGLIISVA